MNPVSSVMRTAPCPSRIALGTALCLLSCALALAEGKPGPRPIGAGGFPVSPMHASAWFAHRADQGGKVLTLMVYFEGSPGWHDKSTDFKWEVTGSPATIDMSVGLTPIHVKYWAETMTVELSGGLFNLGSDNVFLVTDIDGSAPKVRGLGTHDLTFASDDNPALVLLKRDAEVLAALLGEPVKETAQGKNTPAPPADLAAIDRQGLDLLAKNKPEEDRRACDLFRKAAKRGYAPSQYRLGLCYGSGRGVKADLAIANQWYLKAAQQGYTDAQYKLAHSYRVGRGVAIDLSSALQWYTRGAENGDVEAQQNLGVMYSAGQGSEVDLAKAFGWYLKAAENGVLEAQYEVARRYRDGEGVTKDLASSYAWVIVLRSQRKSIEPESWKQVEDLSSSVEAAIRDETKVAAQSMAQQMLRSYTKKYLESLGR